MQHPHENPRITSYLTQMNSHLRGMPQTSRTRAIEEARQHLQSMYELLTSEGLSEADAAAEAIRRFGNASEIGKRLTHEARLAGLAKASAWVKTDLRTMPIRHDGDALLYAFGVFARAFALWCFLAIGLACAITPFYRQVAEHPRLFMGSMDMLFFGILYFGPMVTGWIIGWKIPERALMAVSHVIVGIGAVSFCIDVFAQPGHYATQQWLYWLAASTASAYLASCLKRRRFYRPVVDDFRYRRPAADGDGARAIPTA